MAAKALEGVKVVEYANGIGAPYCTKLLAGMGAQVIKIERPITGDTARSVGPFVGDVPHPEKSIIFLYVNTNKLGITLDLDKDEGIAIFKRLIKNADILVKEGQPEVYAKKGIGYQQLRNLNPGIIVASLTPYGESGPYKDYKAYPINVSHLSAAAAFFPYGSQDMTRPPVMIGGNFEQYDGGAMATIGVLAALVWKRRTGKGQYMELSSLEAMLQIANTENTMYPVYKHSEDRRALSFKSFASLIAPCKDGYVCPVIFSPDDYQRLAVLIGKPEWTKESWYQNVRERVKRIDEVTKVFHDWLKDKTINEIINLAKEARVAIGPVCTPKDVVESEHFKARGFFTEIEHSVCGKMKFPGRPVIMSKTPFSYDRAAPRLGEHNEQVYCEMLGYSERELEQFRKAEVI